MIDTTFQPVTPLTYVGATATQVAKSAQIQQVSTFRVRNTSSGVGYIAWGTTSGVGAPSAPASGTTTTYNAIGLGTGAVCYIAVPSGSFFIGSTGATFEVTGGNGGSGG